MNKQRLAEAVEEALRQGAAEAEAVFATSRNPVSYTHLTLPTN